MTAARRLPLRLRRPAAAAGLAAGALALTLAVGCRQQGDYAGAPIVLISIDTLRSDRLPAYGYGRGSTPAIDALVADGILYERAYTHMPLTLPSHSSILSGQLPTVHGVRDNIGYRYDGEAHPTLATILGEKGYSTGGFVSAYVLREETGIAAGFGEWDDEVRMKFGEVLGNSQRVGSETVAAARRWLAGVGEKPYFLFVHLYDPHTPYAPPQPFASRHADPYDGEIAAADAAVGELLAELRNRGDYDRAIIVLLADHGEGLGDHGEAEHGLLLYREAIQVPLVVKLPEGDRAGTRVAAPVQLVDVFPTLLALAGVEREPQAAPLPGRSLLAEPEGERAIYAETYYPRLHYGWSHLTSLVRGAHHYIESPEPELYDLVQDPAERRNVLRTERRAYVTLRDALAELQTELQAPGEVDAATRDKLAALGYAGTAVKVKSGEVLPTPQSRIHTLADLSRARQLMGEARLVEARPVLEKLVADNPHMVEAWELLGSTLQRLGWSRDAKAAYERAMEESGGAPHIAVQLADVLMTLGRTEEARAHAEIGLEISPATAHEVLARVALEKKDLVGAEREARAAVAARGQRLAPMITLAYVLIRAERLDEALQLTRDAEQELARNGEPTFPGLQLVRGEILARQGRAAEAQRAFEAEIAETPADPRAYTSLAFLHASEGRSGEAFAALRRLISRNESSPAAWAEAVKALRVMGDPEGATILLREAQQRHPESLQLKGLATT